MILFECDYNEGCHPAILKMLEETNFMQTPGYGEDEICDRARAKIRKACGREDVDVHFLVGGTQANKTVIASILRPHQGVISADGGHVNVHETGAIESTGHKVLALPSVEGKITAAQVKEYVDNHYADSAFEHIVQPGMVYISFPTEIGTIYTKQELTELSQVCREYDIPLFVDGARLGYGLVCEENDVTLPELAQLADIFYIGGTKVGALFGEAVVITNPKLKKDFRYFIKQNGGMLAKGRLLGIQFDVLFTDDLYFEISRHAINMAIKIKKVLAEKQIPLGGNSPTNQLFILATDEQMAKLDEFCSYSIFERGKERSLIRLCTSWATKEENVDRLIDIIRTL